MDFTPKSEDEVIRESVSHKLDRHLINPSKKVCRYLIRTKSAASTFHNSDYLKYKHDGYNDMVDLVDLNIKDPDIIKYIIKFFIGNTMLVTNEFLKSINVKYTGSITTYP